MSAKIYLKKNEERRVHNGHLWIFSNEIERVEGDADNGDIVEVFDNRSKFLCSAFYNKNSLISLRKLSSSRIEKVEEYFKERILQAYSLRKKIYEDRNSFRLCFSESDFLPGLVIDKYNDSYSIQSHSVGIEKIISIIVKILIEEFSAKNIFTKHDQYFRKLEGLPEKDEVFYGRPEIEIISDGRISYSVDFSRSQKTGFFFDQSDNRFTLGALSRGKKFLDVFCNVGGFGLHAAARGAFSVSFIDSSNEAIEASKKNFELNRFESETKFYTGDAFEELQKFNEQRERFDIVNLDPPSFIKNKKSLQTGIAGYEKLNRLGIRAVENDGFLATSSCSHHLSKIDFFKAIQKAALKEKRDIQMIYFNGASKDHPELLTMPETSYLKFAIFKIF